MNEGTVVENVNVKVRPKVFINKIVFNDETELQLDNNSIVVFTGANNCGKSQALKDIEIGMNDDNHTQKKVVKAVIRDFKGDIDQKSFLQNNFEMDQQGNYRSVLSGFSFTWGSLINNWSRHILVNGLQNIFVNRLTTEARLISSNSVIRQSGIEGHPIYRLAKSEEMSQIISDYFYQAFRVDLIVNRGELVTIPLHIGQAPDKNAYTIRMQDDYYKIVSELPKLQDQGDGMRSFASILLNTFTSDHSITLIDEPEAFLHPPQARVLGEMLAKNNPRSRQLFMATHSEDFLLGLLNANSENVSVVRIRRKQNKNAISVLTNDRIKELWSNPILRYSNILSGIFHEKVVVCESDYDCLFYQAVLNVVYENKKEIVPDILFVHSGGKNRVKDIVRALKALDVSVIAITDFDILNQSKNFRSLVAAFGADWEVTFASDMKIIYDGMNAKSKSGNDAWQQIKKIGKDGFSGDEPAAYERVEEKCKELGLFVVPVGEMECFDRTINKEKKEWVYSVLEQYNLASEKKLDRVRKFVEEVVAYGSDK